MGKLKDSEYYIDEFLIRGMCIMIASNPNEKDIIDWLQSSDEIKNREMYEKFKMLGRLADGGDNGW